MPPWVKQRVLITVRTYPVPARKGIEVSCTAGVTDQGRWIRLFPIPYRFLDEDRRFRKYQWIDVDTLKAPNDQRAESYNLNHETISIGATVPPDREWQARRAVLQPLIAQSLCALQKAQTATLGLIKPRKINRLVIEATDPNWTLEQLGRLQQLDLFHKSPAQLLEKLPYAFKYEFTCEEPECRGHSMTCTDWEMGQSYRRWRNTYGDEWERAFRTKYEAEMTDRFDTHFFVGNLHQYPNAWIIVGLFYPPKQLIGDLFA